jgi:hypothetical protein
VALDRTGCLNTAYLCQVHQFFMWCSVETSLGVEAIHDMQSLKATCRSAFEGKYKSFSGPTASEQDSA